MAGQKKSVSEKTIETSILNFLNKIDGCFAFKINNVGIYDPIRKIYRKNKNKHIHNGISDIIGLIDGVFFCIEVKTSKGIVSMEQKEFLNTIENNRGYNGVARSLADAISLIMKWRKKNEAKGLSE